MFATVALKTIDDFYVVRKVSEGVRGLNRAEGAKIIVIYIDFMDNRAEGAKIFGVQIRGQGGREGGAHLMGPDFGRKKSSIQLVQSFY